MHIEGGAASRVGVSDTLGEQTHRRARSSRGRPRTDEFAERARLADVARLSVARYEVAALTVYGQENILARWPNESIRDQLRLAACDFLFLIGASSFCSY